MTCKLHIPAFYQYDTDTWICMCGAATISAQDIKNNERRYACAICGVLRTKDEGGEVFTVCDACWTLTTGESRHA